VHLSDQLYGFLRFHCFERPDADASLRPAASQPKIFVAQLTCNTTLGVVVVLLLSQGFPFSGLSTVIAPDKARLSRAFPSFVLRLWYFFVQTAFRKQFVSKRLGVCWWFERRGLFGPIHRCT
jgi:hypothetical protein